ncbi:hypothetical protein DH2020_002983 [Rehmannia glutinosa]|uniref:DUF4005 domain-containing protein n=1 Tax=Rehmannia glutinosa TaxID=99300 RepID=A0ABR0XVD8_REHGL
MDKASRWIRNFLMGKREDGGKKKVPSFPAETCKLGTVSPVNNTPQVRRRWSFKRSTSKKPITTHKSSRSFDSIVMPEQALLDYQIHQNNAMPLLLNAHAAATKIQAIYRSYLARRALRALRGLVKLQALARGHLVRKQMSSVLRSMHVVMAIQVRARFHRIQTAEESTVILGRRKSYRESSASDRQLIRKEIPLTQMNNTADVKTFPSRGGLRSRSGRIDHTPPKRVEYSRRSISQREYQLKMCPSPSTLSFTDSSSTNNDGQLEEVSLKMARRNSRQYSACPENKHPFILPPSPCPDYTSFDCHSVPNYMTNTKSSKAKARSHSEPRQRPELGTKQKSSRSSSLDAKNDKENQYPWLIKLCHYDKSTNDKYSDFNISDVFIPLQPPINLY